MKSDKIDELANGLEDLTTTVDELTADPPRKADPQTIANVKSALGEASQATARLEDEVEDE